MRRLLLLTSAASLALLASCKSEAPADPTPTAAASATTAPTPTPAPTPTVPARKVSEHDALTEFDYAYPGEAASISDLRGALDDRMAAERSEMLTDARQDRNDAKKHGYEYHPHSRSLDWKVVTDLPGWLSLSTTASSYTGGVHPNYVFDGLLWDKAANRQRDPIDLFASKAALSNAIRKDFCAEIDRERIKRRKERPEAGGLFWECIDPLDQTVILGSANGKTFDRIGILVPPYEAGPYAEGSYEITLPVTAALLALVKPEFRGSFSVKR